MFTILGTVFITAAIAYRVMDDCIAHYSSSSEKETWRAKDTSGIVVLKGGKRRVQ